jgi:hypothetical protein
MANNLLEGATYPLLPITDYERKLDNSYFTSRGNHKSALKNGLKVKELLSKDIKCSFLLT